MGQGSIQLTNFPINGGPAGVEMHEELKHLSTPDIDHARKLNR